MNIEDRLITINEMTRPGENLKKVKRIILSSTNLKNVSAVKCRNDIERFKYQAENYLSYHYIIDLAGNIVRCVPEDEISYSTNKFDIDSESISIAIVEDDENNISTESFRVQIELIQNICESYLLNPLEDIYMIYDITGSRKPRYYIDNKFKFEDLKMQISDNIWYS